MPLRITTWNVNSVRLRLGGLERLVRLMAPDVLCLQETKVRNELFPTADLEALGFRHHVLHGQAGYHGVAIFSKLPLEDARPLDWCGKVDCRHLLAVLPGGIAVHNLYIPAGGDLPDPELNPKFRHKLEMLEALADWFGAEFAPERRALLVGDLNVAPLATDVWNHRALLKVVSHTPVEVAALGRAAALGPLGRRGAPLRAEGAAALQLVELSRARLGGRRSRPAARPHLGHAAARRGAAAGGDPARGAWLAVALRPRPGDRRARRRDASAASEILCSRPHKPVMNCSVSSAGVRPL